MATAVVVGRGADLFLVGPEPGTATRVPLPKPSADPDRAAAEEATLPVGLVRAVAGLGPDVALQGDTPLRVDSLRAAVGRTIALASVEELRRARDRLPAIDLSRERRIALAAARAGLERALRRPEEILITLAREEERFERAVGRESRAAEAFLPVPNSPLSVYAGVWSGLRYNLERHHEALLEALENQARSVAPNLSAVVGERVAARLVSAAGSLAALARMRAGRIQLLGTRRRPSPDRGPRYGIVYRAARMTDVPPGRRGAYARSLAALAAIAARADATTRSDLTAVLVTRRDRRVEQLRGRKG